MSRITLQEMKDKGIESKVMEILVNYKYSFSLTYFEAKEYYKRIGKTLYAYDLSDEDKVKFNRDSTYHKIDYDSLNHDYYNDFYVVFTIKDFGDTFSYDEIDYSNDGDSDFVYLRDFGSIENRTDPILIQMFHEGLLHETNELIEVKTPFNIVHPDYSNGEYISSPHLDSWEYY